MSNYQSRANKVIAQGCGTYSKRADQRVYPGAPTHVKGGGGCMLYDTEGGEYIDYSCGLGANLIDIENSFSLPHAEEVILAERLVKLFPCIDKLKFLKTGSEATQAAVRIARAYKQEYDDRIYGAGMGYHGWHNWCIEAEEPGAGCFNEGYARHNSLDSIMLYLDGTMRTPGYVIIEPIMLDMSKETIDQLKELRALCTKHDIVLIFDEIITGFRTPSYCMSNYLDIQPDIICLGKAMANGYPLAVVGGKAKYMDTPDYFVSSTFSGEYRSLYEASKVLDFLTENKLIKLWELGTWFMAEVNKVIKPLGVYLYGLPTRGTWGGNEHKMALLWQEAVKDGVLLGRAWFITFSHTKKVMEHTLKKLDKVVERIKKGVKLEGQMPRPIFKRN